MAHAPALLLLRVGIAVSILLVWSQDASWGPHVALPVLVLSFWPLGQGWRDSRGLTLRPAIAWGFVAVGLGIAAQLQGWNESLESGRPVAGHWAYLSSLATLAALISVLGARTPGGGAWAMLMGLLVVVLLIPWLEGSGLASRMSAMDRLRLDPPWSIFFVILMIAGVTNYLPTRFGLSAGFLGLSLLVELLGLTMIDYAPRHRAMAWSASPLLLGCGLLLAIRPSRTTTDSRIPVERLWLWFRDHWGVVWALRVRERFHRAAEAAGWPIRLSWQGPIASDGGIVGEIPEAAVRTLATLLRRFADPGRIEQASRGEGPRACRDRHHDG